jgi:hypothetical protein
VNLDRSKELKDQLAGLLATTNPPLLIVFLVVVVFMKIKKNSKLTTTDYRCPESIRWSQKQHELLRKISLHPGPMIQVALDDRSLRLLPSLPAIRQRP